MRTLLSIVFIFVTSMSFGQKEQFIVSGKILDSVSGQPLAGASVFCQNTTKGTVTNAEGGFSIRLPHGGYDLIISYTGYESAETRINNSTTDSIIIMLKQRDMNLSEVVVSASTELADGLEKYGKFFLDHFIGTTPNAAFCSIDNPEALQFFFSKKRNRLKVKAKEDLVITNKALGFKIRYQLDSFAYEYDNGISTYGGFPFFEEMEGTEEEKEMWNENRALAYSGSRLHFLRSWYDSTLTENQFRIEWVDTTKERLTTIPIQNPYDSLYYELVDDEDVEINIPGRIRIIYTGEMPDSTYLAESKLPAHLRAQITLVDIAAPFVIEQNGYFYEQSDLINTGYWSWEKVAELLPYDYEF
jgi:hypothetical protein